ncbi:hypothetical protein OGAPHI_002601 [Ogataea philodendri]|uniref:Uncharacterized protein n=1 Tax=Ogataea philodendri TaxID=1378263 RepID=A0A9P8PBR1_9ASCO|nr:uncharacterized protein OGAPHI_002601 [Ogataea philodendri]KAH3668846.1 hypothetical protein OGAPHI_002601 [Ogataea philodendri]
MNATTLSSNRLKHFRKSAHEPAPQYSITIHMVTSLMYVSWQLVIYGDLNPLRNLISWIKTGMSSSDFSKSMILTATTWDVLTNSPLYTSPKLPRPIHSPRRTKFIGSWSSESGMFVLLFIFFSRLNLCSFTAGFVVPVVKEDAVGTETLTGDDLEADPLSLSILACQYARASSESPRTFWVLSPHLVPFNIKNSARSNTLMVLSLPSSNG